MKKLLIVIFVCLISVTLNSITWERTFGGSGSECGYSVIEDFEGFYIVVGYTESFGSGGKDIYVLKVNSVGDTVWTKTYGGTEDDVALDMHQTDDSCYVLSGYRDDSISYIFKINQEGNIIWEKTYPSFGSARSFDLTFDNGFILASSPYILKLDSLGDSLWSYYVNGSYDVKSVIQTSDSGYILIADYSYSMSFRIIKLDKNISVELDSIYQIDMDYTNKIIQESDSEYVFIGQWDFVMFGYFGQLCKINSEGEILWGHKNKNGEKINSTVVFEDFCMTTDSNFIIAGYAEPTGDPRRRCFIAKYLSNGSPTYYKEFNNDDTTKFNSIELSNDGGYIITGINNLNLYIVKTDSTGEVGIEEEIKENISSNHILNFINLRNRNISFKFTLPTSTNINLEIFDISGRLINTPISGYYSKGEHEINYKFKETGVYFYRLESSYLTETGKFLIVE